MCQFLRSLKDLFFPPICIGCHQCIVEESQSSVGLICKECCDQWFEREARSKGRCTCCGFPIAVYAKSPNVIPFTCLECRKWGFQFSSTRCLGGYEGRLKDLVLQAKMKSGSPVAFALGQAIGVSLYTHVTKVVIPVPMHWRRKVMRQQNTAEVIARGIHSQLASSATLEMWSVRASRATQKQGMLSPDQRRENVRNAFQVTKPQVISGQRVLLVDDVMTTGATLHELTNLLLVHGAIDVEVAVVCRAGGGYR